MTATVNTLRDQVIATLRTIHDPEIPVNIYDLGLIYSVRIEEGGLVFIDMTLTSPNCPVVGEMPDEMVRTVSALEGVSGCTVELVWEPPWDPSRMSDEAKVELDMFY
ncbi:MAG: SUF system Fe-S cluster assembly protein [Rhodospirillaceae bacterium]